MILREVSGFRGEPEGAGEGHYALLLSSLPSSLSTMAFARLRAHCFASPPSAEDLSSRRRYVDSALILLVCLFTAQKRLRELKGRISTQSKKNFVLERDVRYLDSRIALLIANRMALDEVSQHRTNRLRFTTEC